MSRIGKLPIIIPSGVEIKTKGKLVTVKGALGSLEYTLPEQITVELKDSELIVKRPSDHRTDRSLHGLARALIFNMVTGVSKGFEKTLIVEGVGYKAMPKGDLLVMTLGFSHPIEYKMPKGVSFTVVKNSITLKGIDKQAVGQTAAIIRDFRRVEPYKGKGIRYSDEQVRRKVGKVGT